MKNLAVLKPLLLCFLLFPVSAHADSVTAEMLEERNYRLQEVVAMQFGKIVSPRHGRTVVTIDPRSGMKNVAGPYDFGGNAGPAVFEVEAAPGAEFSVYVPSQAVAQSATGRAEIRDISVYPEGIIKAGPDGRAQFSMGGTLVIPAGVNSGGYRARIPVRLNRIME